MSKLIECDKCKQLKNAFGCSYLIDGELKAVLCDVCTDDFHQKLDKLRSEFVKMYLGKD